MTTVLLRVVTNSPKGPTLGLRDPRGAPATLLTVGLSELLEDLPPRAQMVKAALAAPLIKLAAGRLSRFVVLKARSRQAEPDKPSVHPRVAG